MELSNGISVLIFIGAAVLAVFHVFLLFSARRKKVVNIPFSLILAPIVLCVGLLYFIAAPSLFSISLTILLENVLLIPHYLDMKSVETTKKRKSTTRYEVQETEPTEAPTKEDAPSISSTQSLIETSKAIVFKASDLLSDSAGLARLIDFVNTGIMREISADGAAVLLIDDFDDIIAVKAFAGDFPPPYKLPDDVPHKIIRVETNFRFAQFGLTENIFGEIARSGKAELVTEPLSDPRIFQNEDEDFLKCGSYIFAPMVVGDSVIGITAFARVHDHAPFSQEDFQKAVVLTEYASASIKTMYTFQEVIEHTDLTREAGIAGKIQKTMHPQLLPAIPGLQLGSVFNTAEGVCGDYFDVVPSRKDRISFILADVAGKGMNSLVIMIMLRAILRLVTNTNQSAATILAWANRGIAIDNNIDHFASLSLLNYDTTTKRLQYSTAGSPPVLHYNSQNDTITRLQTSAEPIGVEKSTQFHDEALQLHSGDLLVLYSDGLIEAINTSGQQYTTERLISLVKEHKDKTSNEIAGLVKADVKKFTGAAHQHDDQTLLVIKIQ